MTQPVLPAGPFVLAGPVGPIDPRTVPLRGDLAHIALAGQRFVPHYAVPQSRLIGAAGANVMADPNDTSDVLAALAAGDSFDVLDITGQWAWGCLSLDGPVGYVHISRLAAIT